MSGFKRRARDQTTGVQTNRRPPWGPIPAAMGVVQVLWPARESSVPLTLTVLPQEARATALATSELERIFHWKKSKEGHFRLFLTGKVSMSSAWSDWLKHRNIQMVHPTTCQVCESSRPFSQQFSSPRRCLSRWLYVTNHMAPQVCCLKPHQSHWCFT